MKLKSCFLGKKKRKKNITSLSPVEFVQRVVKVNNQTVEPINKQHDQYIYLILI